MLLGGSTAHPLTFVIEFPTVWHSATPSILVFKGSCNQGKPAYALITIQKPQWLQVTSLFSGYTLSTWCVIRRSHYLPFRAPADGGSTLKHVSVITENQGKKQMNALALKASAQRGLSHLHSHFFGQLHSQT